uniref:Putative ovule protein n=1 Tax=Solanum chacoense TaxID=4108 RepID=A0A0V0HBN6_SOLCH
MCKEIDLGHIQPQRLAHMGRIVQEHIRRSITPSKSNVGFLHSPTCPDLVNLSVDNIVWGPTSVN